MKTLWLADPSAAAILPQMGNKHDRRKSWLQVHAPQSKLTSAHARRPCSDSIHQKLPRSTCIFPARISSIAFTRRATATCACSPISSACSATAVINKRAGGTGLISGRKAFQRPMKEGVQLLNAIQDVYLSPEVTIA